jgi:rhodanese-related sulfurtransferase
MPPPISPDALLERQARHDPTLMLVDVRTPQEFAAGHVPGAVNIPYDQVASHLAEIPRDEDVVVYCHSGRRAGLAGETLEKAGYKRVLHLQGDMQGWQKDGRPVEASAKPDG